jgi:hypothetical protein
MTYISYLAFVKFGDKTFKIVVEIVGLRIGTLVAPNNDVSLEIQSRILTASILLSVAAQASDAVQSSFTTNYIIEQDPFDSPDSAICGNEPTRGRTKFTSLRGKCSKQFVPRK